MIIRVSLRSFTLAFALLAANAAIAEEQIAKVVYLIVEGDKLIASNSHLSRFDEYTLGARERIEQQAEGEAVAVVYTNRNIIGYSVFAGWRAIRTEANEQVERIEVEDYSALVVTSRRLLNFNGRTGVWASRDR